MEKINRIKTDKRMSQMVIYNKTVYLSGQVGNPGDEIKEQTRTCLEKVELLLHEAGSDKTRILQATVWLSNMKDFEKMNEVWDVWIGDGNAPARACGESKLATPEYKVELIVVAAI